MPDTFTLKFAAVILAAALAALGILAFDAEQAAARDCDCRRAGGTSACMICRNDARAAFDDKVSGLISTRSASRLGSNALIVLARVEPKPLAQDFQPDVGQAGVHHVQVAGRPF